MVEESMHGGPASTMLVVAFLPLPRIQTHFTRSQALDFPLPCRETCLIIDMRLDLATWITQIDGTEMAIAVKQNHCFISHLGILGSRESLFSKSEFSPRTPFARLVRMEGQDRCVTAV